jgi:hypothetical protein
MAGAGAMFSVRSRFCGALQLCSALHFCSANPEAHGAHHNRECHVGHKLRSARHLKRLNHELLGRHFPTQFGTTRVGQTRLLSLCPLFFVLFFFSPGMLDLALFLDVDRDFSPRNVGNIPNPKSTISQLITVTCPPL